MLKEIACVSLAWEFISCVNVDRARRVQSVVFVILLCYIKVMPLVTDVQIPPILATLIRSERNKNSNLERFEPQPLLK